MKIHIENIINSSLEFPDNISEKDIISIVNDYTDNIIKSIKDNIILDKHSDSIYFNTNYRLENQDWKNLEEEK